MRRLLIFSLLLNACLLVLAAYQFRALHTGTTPANLAGQPGKMAAAALRVSAPETRGGWTAIQSADWKVYVKNLRATGCPEETTRDIIFAEVNKTYAARWRSIDGDDGKKYWVSKRQGWWGHARQKQFNALEREKKELIEQILGVDADAQLRKYLVLNYDAAEEDVRRLDFLPANRREKLNKVMDKDDKAIHAVWLKQEPGGGLPPAGQHELNVALQQRNKDLAKMLSSAEMEEYDLRNSQQAKDLRRQLYGFEATETEFWVIFTAQKKLQDKFTDLPYNSTDETINQKRAVAAEVTETEIRGAIGEKRYTEYLRVKTVQYQQLLNFTDEFELSRDIANRACEIIERAGASLKRVHGDTSLSAEQRQARIAAVQAETDQALAQAMGEKGLKYYKQNYGGWLANAGR
jgi:hypothetical protein